MVLFSRNVLAQTTTYFSQTQFENVTNPSAVSIPPPTYFPNLFQAPAVSSNLCSPNAPARISGSTGEQGVLDPGNTSASDGLVWPGTAVLATLFLDTGQVLFTDASNVLVGTAILPGVSGFPAFPAGKLNFTNVRLPAGKGVVIAATATPAALFTSELGVAPPALVLSCQDVVLEAGSSLAVGLTGSGAPIFQPTATPAVFAGGRWWWRRRRRSR